MGRLGLLAALVVLSTSGLLPACSSKSNAGTSNDAESSDAGLGTADPAAPQAAGKPHPSDSPAGTTSASTKPANDEPQAQPGPGTNPPPSDPGPNPDQAMPDLPGSASGDEPASGDNPSPLPADPNTGGGGAPSNADDGGVDSSNTGGSAGSPSVPQGAGGAAEPNPDQPAPDPNPFGAPQAFIQNCAICHGVDAKGIENLGPEIEHAAPTLVDYYVRNGDNNEWGGPDKGCVEDTSAPEYTERGCDKWGPQLVMTKFDSTSVSDADLDAIKTWLDQRPMPSTGQELYGDFCAFCHGPGGDIPALTYYVKNSDIVASVALWQPDTSQPDAPAFESTVKNGLTAQPPDRRDAYMPPLGTQLTDQQILEIARWMCTQSYASVPGFCSQLPQ